jgi:hypothetical protein
MSIVSRIGRGRAQRSAVDADLRARCERWLDGLDVPDPFDLHVFVERLSVARGRPLLLVPYRFAVAGAPCGLWVPLPDADVVFVEEATAGAQRDNIVAHEIGHLLADHEADSELVRAYRARLFPSLDPSVVDRVLGRTSYTTAQEQEAEVFAWLLLGRRAWVPPRDDHGAEVGRAHQLFGPSR